MNERLKDLLGRGMELAREGRWEEGGNLLSQVVAEDPECFEALLWLGATADDPRDSFTYLERALRLNRNSVRAQKGLEWAKERLAKAEPPAETASTPSLSLAPPSATGPEPVEAIEVDEWTPSPAGAAAVETEAAPPEPAPAPGETPGLDGVGASPPLPGAEPYPQLPAILDSSWKEEGAFSDEGLSPVNIVGDETTFPPAPPEPAAPSLIELPRAILSAFESERDFQPEENPLTAPLFDDIAAQFRTEAHRAPADERVTSAPGPPEQEPQVPDEATAPMESWDAIIARLRALDDQFVKEEKASPPAEDVAEAQREDLAPAADLFAPPSPVLPEPLDRWAPSTQDAVQPVEPAAGPLGTGPAQYGAGESPAELVAKGKVDLEAGRMIEAIQSFQRALALDPDNVEANEQLGVAKYQSGDVDGAIAAFETVVELKPSQAEGFANLGFLYAEKGAPDRAIAAFQEALRRDSSLLEAHLSLADLFKARGNMDEAIKAWSAAVLLRPDLTDVHANLGEAYAERGQLTEAIWEYRLVAEHKPADARAHLRLGQLLFQSGRSVDAANEYGDALRISPSLPEAHYGLASCLEEQGKREQAIAELEQALAIKPDYLEADGKLARLQASMPPMPLEEDRKEVSEEPEKKSRWGFFKRDKK